MFPSGVYLRPREVAEALKLTRSSIYRLFWEEKLDGFKVEGAKTVRILSDSVNKLIGLSEMKKKMPMCRRYRPDELAELLSVTPRTIYRWMKSGNLRFSKTHPIRGRFVSLPSLSGQAPRLIRRVYEGDS